MISKKNSVLIFEPQNFLKNTLTDQNLTFPFKIHEIFGGLLSYETMRDFFFWGGGGGEGEHAQEVK